MAMSLPHGVSRALPLIRSVGGALLAGVAWGVTWAGHAAPAPVTPRPVDFSSEVRPILSSRCLACHGPDDGTRKAGLRLDTRELATKPSKDGRVALVPGQPDASELVRRILSKDPDDVMPPPETHNVVTADEAALLRRWIAEGADYAPHWAWRKPSRPALPRVRNARWPLNGIDHFILARLEAEGLQPSPKADVFTLARRAALDLTGLPPEPDLVDRLANDRSAGAWGRYVDALLESPHFGERWARVWLDIARYADSAGLGSDPLRPNIWPYRDWVIQAFNHNLPYDRFTLDQLAGDLQPGASRDQVVATAFHRNTMTNTEGGTDDEEWRVAAVKDRANVTAQAWMGLTMGCAQCHTHKFDPITQREYYAFYAFFNQTEDNDQPDERPTFALLSDADARRRAALEAAVRDAEAKYQDNGPDYAAERDAWAAEAGRAISWSVATPAALRSGLHPGTTFQPAPDGSVLVGGPNPDRDQYLVTLPIPAGTTAVRLEALADPSLPKKGPGRRAGEGNFVLNDLRAFHDAPAADAKPMRARFIRVEGEGGRRQLALAEVQVLSGGTNVAPAGKASQSTVTYLADAARATDGNIDGNVNATHSVALTLPQENPWWELDLGRELPLDEVVLWNRTDGGGDQLGKARVALLDAGRSPTQEFRITNAPAPMLRLRNPVAQPVALREATADHAQGGFSAAAAIDGNTHRDSGWAIGGALGQDHALAFELSQPPSENTLVTFVLSFSFGEGQNLGRFRFSTTRQATPVRLQPAAIAAVLALPESKRTADQRRVLDDHFRPRSKTRGDAGRALAARRSELDAVRGTPVPVLRELPAASRRKTHVLHKGNFQAPGDEVSAGTPAAFHAWPDDAPRDRRGLAAWLTHPDNPLTARVAVNRFWAQLLGQGLVETEEDFGTQGTLPSHPELLDWLAVTFASPKPQGSGARPDPRAPALGWDIKALMRLIVTSATYQQSSAHRQDLASKDPRNRWHGRAERRRLEAEAVRDQALAVSGLLSRRIGGPSVYPAQPDGLWRAAFNGERTWSTSEGENRYRRGIYTFLRRTVPYPSMATFDAPSREQCTLRRQPTNTPLQAFVTLNDPVFVEAAQALGRAMAAHPAPDVAARIRFGWRKVTGRPPTPSEVARLVALFHDQRAAFHSTEPEARRLATEPIGPLPPGLTPADAAAWTSVGNVLLNLDLVLNRG